MTCRDAVFAIFLGPSVLHEVTFPIYVRRSAKPMVSLPRSKTMTEDLKSGSPTI